MKLLIQAVLLIFASLTSNCILAEANHGRSSSEIHQVSSYMEWSLFTPQPKLFSTTELFYLENEISDFFTSLIRNSLEFKDESIYMVSFDIRDQDVDTTKVEYKMDAKLTIMYRGAHMDNFSDRMSETTQDIDSDESLLRELIQTKFFGITSISSSMSFGSAGPSNLVAIEQSSNLLFIILLSFVTILMIASFLILGSSDIFKCLRRKNELLEIKHCNTEDTESISSPQMLGARIEKIPSPDDSRYAITSTSCMDQPHPTNTPYSKSSQLTELSPENSTASANPLGIVRLNKLVKLENNSRKRGQSLYNISLTE